MSSTTYTPEEWVNTYYALVKKECTIKEIRYPTTRWMSPQEREDIDAVNRSRCEWQQQQREEIHAMQQILQHAYDPQTQMDIAVRYTVLGFNYDFFQIISDIAELVVSGALTEEMFSKQQDFMQERFPKVELRTSQIFQFAAQTYYAFNWCHFGANCKNTKCKRLHGRKICVSHNSRPGGCTKIGCGRAFDHLSYVAALFKNTEHIVDFDFNAMEFLNQVHQLAYVIDFMDGQWQFFFAICTSISVLPNHARVQQVPVSKRLNFLPR